MAGECSYRRRHVLKTLSVLPAAWMSLGRHASAAPSFAFSCSTLNDLYKLLVSSGARLLRYETPEEAVAKSSPGSGVLILAEGYPDNPTKLNGATYRQAAEKKLRLYVEFPSLVPGLQVGRPSAVAKGRYGNLFERLVVASNSFSPSLE